MLFQASTPAIIDAPGRPLHSDIMLFVQGLMGALQHQLSRIPRGVRHRVISLCGFICLATPLALWISMTIWGFKLILGVFCIAMLLLTLMIWSSPDERI